MEDDGREDDPMTIDEVLARFDGEVDRDPTTVEAAVAASSALRSTAKDWVDALPRPSTIEIVRLDPDSHATAAREIHGRTGGVVETVEGKNATRLLRLVRALPWGDQARCHMPRYALRIRGATPTAQPGVARPALVTVSLCFRCSNALAYDGTKRSGFEFDASSSAASRLLRRLRRHDQAEYSSEDL